MLCAVGLAGFSMKISTPSMMTLAFGYILCTLAGMLKLTCSLDGHIGKLRKAVAKAVTHFRKALETVDCDTPVLTASSSSGKFLLSLTSIMKNSSSSDNQWGRPAGSLKGKFTQK